MYVNMLERLLNLRFCFKHKPLYHFDEDKGICNKLSSKQQVKQFLELIKEWPNHSGNNEYPVPSPISGISEVEAWKILHKWRGEYGELRLNLLQYAIEKASYTCPKCNSRNNTTRRVLSRYGDGNPSLICKDCNFVMLSEKGVNFFDFNPEMFDCCFHSFVIGDVRIYTYRGRELLQNVYNLEVGGIIEYSKNTLSRISNNEYSFKDEYDREMVVDRTWLADKILSIKL